MGCFMNDDQNWTTLAGELDARGWAMLPGLLDADSCARIAAGYDEPAQFRSQVVMARHGFGRGEYSYYRYPLPDPIAGLRSALYPRLAPIANRWHERLGLPTRFPADHGAADLSGADGLDSG